MTAHEGYTNRVADDAFLFRTGALPAESADAYARHVDACGFCAGEVGRVDRVFAELGSLFEAEPGRALRGRLLERFASETAARIAVSRTVVARSDEIPWEESGIPGVRIKRLFVDPKRRRMAALLLMDRGVTFPPHAHADDEEFILLEGDLRIDETTVMRPGDYQRASAGSRHDPQTTENGCLLFLLSSTDDVSERGS